MRFPSQPLSPLAAAAVLVFASAWAGVVAVPSPDAPGTSPAVGVSPPQFKAVFTGQFDMSSRHVATGPFGTRVHNAMSGGSIWDAATGAVVADILPFADDGVSSAAGPFFPVALVPLVWRADGHYAAFSTVGVRGRTEKRSWEYAHVETDSPTYAWMNSRFFILRVNSTAAPRLTFTMYEETS